MVGRSNPTAVRTVAVVAIAALMVTAGCVGSLGGGDGGTGTPTGTNGGDGSAQGPPGIGAVPAKAQMVASYDTGMVTDPTTQAVANAYLQEVIPEESDQPRSVDAILERARSQMSGQTNLSLAAVSGATMFVEYPSTASMMSTGQGASPEDQYVGVLVRSSWSEEEVVSLIRQQSSADTKLQEETYKGTTIYSSESASGTTAGLAKYGDNEWVFGTMAAVKDVIDVANGDADPVGGQLKTAYQGTTADGYVRFASTVPQEYRRILNSPMGERASMGGVSASSFTNVTAVAGSYYTEGGQDGSVGMNVMLHFDGTEPANSVTRQLDGAVAYAQDNVRNETLKTHLDAINVSREGATVTVGYEASVGELRTLFEQFLNFPYGMGMGGSTVATGAASQAPQAGFAFEYEAGSGQVTVTLTSASDPFDASNVVARCGGETVDVPDDLSVGGTFTVDRCSPGDTLSIVHRSPESTRVIADYQIPGSASVVPVAG